MSIGTCGRCGEAVAEQRAEVVDRIYSRRQIIWIHYLITNSPCGCAKHSTTGNGSEALVEDAS